MKFMRLMPFIAIAMTACDTATAPIEVSSEPAKLQLQYFLTDTPTVGTTYNVFAKVVDAAGRGVGGTTVRVETGAFSGGAPATVFTGSDGSVRIQWMLDIQAGVQTLRGVVEGLDPVEIRVPTRAGEARAFTIERDTIVLNAFGQTAMVQIRGFDEFGNPNAEGFLNWISRDARIASVDADGVVRPVSFGKVWVIGSLANGVRDSVLVDVATPPQ